MSNLLAIGFIGNSCFGHRLYVHIGYMVSEKLLNTEGFICLFIYLLTYIIISLQTSLLCCEGEITNIQPFSMCWSVLVINIQPFSVCWSVLVTNIQPFSGAGLFLLFVCLFFKYHFTNKETSESICI